jgi:hypothetical protein
MNFCKLLGISLLNVILVACGGGGSGSPVATGQASTDSNQSVNAGIGSNISSVDLVTKYNGTWVAPCRITGTETVGGITRVLNSKNQQIIFTNIAPSTLTFVFNEIKYSGSGASTCSGTVTSIETTMSSGQVIGTKTIATHPVEIVLGGFTADRTITDYTDFVTGALLSTPVVRTYAEDQTTTSKGVFAIIGNTLRSGDDTQALDADGVPTLLDNSYIFIKRP